MPLKVLKITHLKPSPSYYEGETKAQGQLVALHTSNQKSHAPGPLWRCLLVLQQDFHSPRAGNSRVDCRLDWYLLTG